MVPVVSDHHDQVLKVIAWEVIPFIRGREQPASAKKNSTRILVSAKDWKLLIDLERQLKFLQHTVTTTLRADIVLWSECSNQ